MISFSVNPGGAKGSYYGKKPAELQDFVSIYGTEIYGNLKPITGYEEFSRDPSEQNGHYLVLDFSAEEGSKIETMITGGNMQDYVDATTDKWCVYRVQNTSQTIKVKVTKAGQNTETVYKLTELTLL